MSDYRVIIRKGELFIRCWNSETRSYEEKSKTEQVLSDVLQFPVDIEDTTFGQFFGFIAREAELFERIFKAAMYGHPLAPYLREIAEPEEQSDGIDFVRVYWAAEIDADGDVEIWPGFDGIGDWPPQEGEPVQKGGIAIEYTPLNHFKGLPLKLEKKFSLYAWTHNAKEGIKELCCGEREFSVYDVLKSVLFELTWSGDISKGREAGCPFDKKQE